MNISIKNIVIAVTTAACVSIPAYGFNWAVDVDRKLHAVETKLNAEKAAREERAKVDKEFRDMQIEAQRIMAHDIKKILSQTRN